MNILLIDNYDSFTYNLAHRLREVSGEIVTVIRNDELKEGTLNEYSHLVLSPGPGIPEEAGQLMKILEEAKDFMPILGVCLGHQALAQSFGGTLKNLEQVVHGKEHQITLEDDTTLFKGLTSPLAVGRYHSWVVDQETLPKELRVTAYGPDGEIMAVEHTTLPLFGVQFHPESVMTKDGHAMLKNWLAL
jgi:anthranilate synthase component 2